MNRYRQLRREGYAAYVAGKSRESNPHSGTDRFEWFAGYGQADFDYQYRATRRDQ